MSRSVTALQLSDPVTRLTRSWVVCGTVNAKNRFGGYVGARPFYAAFRDGQLLTVRLQGGGSLLDSAGVIVERCAEWYERRLQ